MKNQEYQPKTMKTHETTLQTMKAAQKTCTNYLEKPWKPTQNHEKSCNYLINHENQPKTKKLHWKPRCTMHYMLCTMHLLIFFPITCADKHTNRLCVVTTCADTQTNSALSLYIDDRNDQNPHHQHSPQWGRAQANPPSLRLISETS